MHHRPNLVVKLAWRNDSIIDCHKTPRGSIPDGNGVKTELHILCKGQLMGVPSLNDLAVDGTSNINQSNLPKSSPLLMVAVPDLVS